MVSVGLETIVTPGIKQRKSYDLSQGRWLEI